MENGKDILTADEAAELLSFTPRVIREMLKKGELPGAKLRGKWRMSRRQLIEHVENLATGGAHVPITDEILDGTFPDIGSSDVAY